MFSTNRLVLPSVILLLLLMEYGRYWIGFVPGYSALREGFPYWIGGSFRSLIEIALVIALAFALLKNSGQRILDILGLGSSPVLGLKAALIMVLPLYLVFAFAFVIAELVPMEVLYLAVISPFAEELLYRGFAFGMLRRVAGMGFWPSAILPALFFGWGHFDQANDLFSTVMTLGLTGGGALLFAWLFEKWGGIWVPLGLHVMINFAWNLFAVGDGAFAGTLPTIMQLSTVLFAIIVTVFRAKIKFLRE